MDTVNYSKNWDSIFSMPEEELYKIDPKAFDEEDLDALSIRLSELNQKDKVLSVYQDMLLTDKRNPAVEYTNIYEKVIIHLMGEKDYTRASSFLEGYLVFDDCKRNGYRSNFIRRNLGVCYIFSGEVEKGEKVIEALINEFPNDFFTYNELAIEFYYAGDKKSMLKYLYMGMDKAKICGSDFWFNYFSNQVNEVEK